MGPDDDCVLTLIIAHDGSGSSFGSELKAVVCFMML